MADQDLEGADSIEVEMTPEEMQVKTMRVYAEAVQKIVLAGIFDRNLQEFEPFTLMSPSAIELAGTDDFIENYVKALSVTDFNNLFPDYRTKSENGFIALNQSVYEYMRVAYGFPTVNRTNHDVIGSKGYNRSSIEIGEHLTHPSVVVTDLITLLQISFISNPELDCYDKDFGEQIIHERMNLYLDFIENNLDRVLAEWQERMRGYQQL